ncbi:MAG: HEPN domain-containing protein [Chloroflexota bacterium]|nr:HEPN domain-containing protein [Chloroflexota bacterium]
MEATDVRQRIAQYIERARMVLNSGELVLEHEDYITAVNRAYYTIFYAANAMLATRGLERSKHSGAITAFRQHFVKTGIIEVEYSDFYGAAMEDR